MVALRAIAHSDLSQPSPVSAEEMKTRKQAVEMLAKHVVQAEELDRKGFTGSKDELFNQLMPGKSRHVSVLLLGHAYM
jgi:hypothetical protein